MKMKIDLSYKKCYITYVALIMDVNPIKANQT